MHIQVKQKLKAIEFELKNIGWWQSTIDEAAILKAQESTMPFCCDTMELELWLQSVFLPKMGVIIEEQLALPRSLSIAPIALHVWANNKDAYKLISILEELDGLFSARD